MKQAPSNLRTALLICALAASSMGTSCFLSSHLVLTPSPTQALDLPSHAIALTDTIARNHGLKPKEPWSYSTVRGAEGTAAAAWGKGSLWLTVCVERVQAGRIEIEVRRNGYWWKAADKGLRQELADTLRAVFGTEVVTVVSN
jgi:hypothetical protein